MTIALALVPGTAQASAILDTDLHADVDEAAALAMIHELDIDLLAVMISSPGASESRRASSTATRPGPCTKRLGEIWRDQSRLR